MMRQHTRWLLFVVFVFAIACSGPRLFYVASELPKLDEHPELELVVGLGPWPVVPAVVSDSDGVPDDLVLPVLKALMSLPGAADSCDLSGQPRPDAAEYCVAVYKTPEDWRVTWPIRKMMRDQSACQPPFGGVEDADFGRDLPVFGYAHNHTCGLFASSNDLRRFPAAKAPTGAWVVVGYATTPSGKLVRDVRGELIPAWGWLATGHLSEPRFYKWNLEGKVFRWNEDKAQWEFQADCKPQSSHILTGQVLPPRCSPELIDWY
jgi:hypothetical protein